MVMGGPACRVMVALGEFETQTWLTAQYRHTADLIDSSDESQAFFS